MGREMEEVYTSQAASRHQINLFSEWVKENVGLVECGELDVIRFVEIDLQAFFPGFYLEIKSDEEMGRVKAHLSHDSIGIVVSETTYNLACQKNLDASETILHEVGHLFLHRNYAPKGLNDARGRYRPQFQGMSPTNSVEWQAKFFARCMLFPYSKMKSLTKRLEFQVYFDLSVFDADRAMEHTRALRLSESGRCVKRENTWLATAIGKLEKSRRIFPDSDDGQLSLFYRPNNACIGKPYPDA